jgi:hypothetical protein
MAEAEGVANADVAGQAAVQQPEGAVNTGDLEARLRTDPEFAVKEYKKLQSDHGRLTSRLQQLKQAEDVARAVGGGDVKAGSEALSGYAQYGYQIQQNSQLNEVVQRALQTGALPETQTASTQVEDEYVDPEVQSLRNEIQGLKQMLGSVQTDTSFSKVKTLANDFRETDIGQALTNEEWNELVGSWEGNVKTWASAPNGTELLRGLSKEQLRVMALNHFDQKGQLQEIYGRIAAGKDANRQRFSTEGPGEIGGESAVRPEFGSVLEAFEHAKRQYS